MDARKGQLYAAVFGRTATGVALIGEERAVSPEEACDTDEAPGLFVGDGAVMHADLIRAPGPRACFHKRRFRKALGPPIGRDSFAAPFDDGHALPVPSVPRDRRVDHTFGW